MWATGRPSGGAGMPNNYTTVTDAGGNFTIKDVEPGKYTLTAQRTGYVTTQYGARGPGRSGTTLTLDPGKRVKDLVWRLTPHGVISGRVVDENDDPAISIQVQATHYSYQMGKKELTSAGGATTNDLGEFRLYGLAPGRYYLTVSPADENFEALEDKSAAPAAEHYVTTYYPGTKDPAAAAPLEVGPGAQVRGINIAVARARTYYVRGRVVGQGDAYVDFLPRDQLRTNWWLSQHPTDQKGNFEIRDVMPGEYIASADSWEDQRIYSASMQVTVSDSNVENVVLALAPGAEISGRIVVEGNAAVNLDGVTIYLSPRDQRPRFYGGGSGGVHDGAFTLTNVGAEAYTVNVMQLPDGFWVRSIRMGDEEVKHTGIDLTRSPAAPITITIAPNAGQIHGAVVNDKQQPAPGATVVLVPEPELRDRIEAFGRSVSDQNGRFSLKNLSPGEYKLFAWEDVEYGAYVDPDFLGPVENRGQSISIHEGSHESVQLDLIPADAGAKAQREGR